jgi:hypothetical protein
MLALARSSMSGRSESPVDNFLNVRLWPKADLNFTRFLPS